MRTVFGVVLALSLGAALAQQPASVDTAAFREMTWRNIGPMRGGRTKAAAGIPLQPNVFFVGAVDGGVWKTTDAGRTWTPIFDDQPTGSIGAIAVSGSNPDVIYVGSGEGLHRPDLSTGDGMYKSIDGGKTWAHLPGLRDSQQIPQIALDPRDPNRLFAAVLGHPYGANAERGIFRSSDGGQHFDRVLFKDENTGGVDVVLDPSNANTVYAALWEERQGPWENGVFTGPGSAVYKSTDGGTTWRAIVTGLPTYAADGLGRIGLTVAPSNPQRLFATIDAEKRGGLYRSDDAGEHWSLINGDPRVTNRASDFGEVKVDPKNADIVYTASVVAWKSTDGGKTFAALRGAPGGDDYHRFWINPDNTDIMLLAGDQGAIVTVNGGVTWSSWYNQPTAQMYHVSADNAFPYRVCSGQQDSGSACVASRGIDGQITMREWHPVAAEEWGYVAADPNDPDIVYGGKLTRYDRRTGQAQDILPPQDVNFRTLRTAPVLFSPLDAHTLFFASNVLWKTTTGGQSWTAISPDLTRTTWELPANVGTYRESDSAKPSQRGVIYTVAPSYVAANVIWAGTDDGVIQLTRDAGKTWTNVTPPQLAPWSKVSIMDASHFDENSAYAAINSFRLDDLRPHILRTRDGGRTWVEIVRGLPAGAIVNVVREDTLRRGLLFAGTEQAVFVSFDDGDSWQPLRLNMPATSIRDLTVKDDDLIAGTHGRGFWILDDITPLRQSTPEVLRASAFLFRPATAWRVRWNTNPDTPMPPDEPTRPNPSDGAVIYYSIGANATGAVTLEIAESNGAVIRTYSSTDPVDPPVEGRNIPDYWIRPSPILSSAAGLHRFIWDLRYPRPAAGTFDYAISAVALNTPQDPQGLFVLPGTYRLRLTVNGRALTQALTVRMDPRVKTSAADLTLQFTWSKKLHDLMAAMSDARADVAKRLAVPGADQAALRAVQAQLNQAFEPLPAIFARIQGADVRPTAAAESAANAAIGTAESAIAAYKELK